jgi:hypothetical protein
MLQSEKKKNGRKGSHDETTGRVRLPKRLEEPNQTRQCKRNKPLGKY